MAHHPPFASSTTTGPATTSSSSLASRIALSSLLQGPASLAFASAPALLTTSTPLAFSPSSGHKRKLSQTVSANNIMATSSASASSSSVRLSSSIGSSILPRTATGPAMVSTPNMRITTPSASSSALPVNSSGSNATPVPLSPAEYWKSLLKEWNIPILDSVGIDNDMAADNDNDEIQFLETTPDRIDAYQNTDLLTAVRRRDLDKLRKIGAEFSAAGKTMNACNRFGESILHLACRKCSTDVVQFLIDDEPTGMGCSLLVRDDYGRTVLHDACWTISPPWILLKLILKESPILWRVSDVRGHLALQYVPKSVWSKWITFIQENQFMLKQIMISSYYNKESGNEENDETMGIPQQPVPQPQDSTMMNTTSSQPPGEGTTRVAAAAHTNAAVNNPKIAAAVATASPASVSRATTPQSSVKQVTAVGPIGSQDAQIRQLEATFAIQAAQSALALGCGGGIAKTSEAQETAVLAKALAQANPEMMLALSLSQPRPQQQGVQQIPSRQQQASSSTVFQQAPATSVRATGPATAALAAALQRPQFSGHGNRRSINLQSSKDSSSSLTQSELQKQPSKSPKQCIPYAPSISMIAARLAGYQRATTARELQQQANIHTGEANGHPIGAVSSDATAACATAISQQGQDQARTTTMEYVVGNVPNPLRQQKQLEDHNQEEERMEVQQQQGPANNSNSNININNNNIDSINSSNIPNPTKNTNSTTSRGLLSSIPPTSTSRSSSSTTLTDFGSNSGNNTTTTGADDTADDDDVPNPLRGQQQEEVDHSMTITTANAAVCSPLSSTTTTPQKKDDVDSDDTAPCCNAVATAVADAATHQLKLEGNTSSSSFNKEHEIVG